MRTDKKQKIRLIIFALIYCVSSLFMVTQLGIKLSGVINTYCYIALFFVIIAVCAAAVIINRDNIEKVLKIYAVEANLALIIYSVIYGLRIATKQKSFFTLIWICCGFLASVGVIAGVYICKKNISSRLIENFWLYFTPTYAFVYLVAFLRKPNSYYELNLTLGKGILSYFDYLSKAFESDIYLVFNIVGNFVFFIPLIFIVKALITKLKPWQAFLVSCVLPFIAEGYQYIFKCGSVDVDDIFLNISGIVTGYAVYAFINRKRRRNKEDA